MTDDKKPDSGQPPRSGQDGQPSASDELTKRLAALEEQVKTSKVENDTLKEDLKRTNALLEAAWEPEAGSPKGDPDPRAKDGPRIGRDYTPLGISNDAAAAIIEEAKELAKSELRTEYDLRMQAEAQRKAAQERFYKTYPELVGHERLVGVFANEVQREFPNMRTSEAMVEVAKRTREYVTSKFSPSGGNPPPVLSGSKTGADGRPLPGEGKPDDFQPENPDDVIRDEIKERNEARRAGLRG